MTPTCARCIRPPTGRGEYPHLCFACTPGEDDFYPVLVEYTQRHVVWVAAFDQKTAVEYMQNEPYEKTSDQETLCDAGWTVTAPASRWDWDSVYEGGYYHPYDGLRCDAHVETHRRHLAELARMFLEATAENEDRMVAAGVLAKADRRTCGLCPDWLDADHVGSVRHAMSVRMAEAESRARAEAVATP